MAMRTQASPAVIDGQRVEEDEKTFVAGGKSAPQAVALAFAKQGVALYQGDFMGGFARMG